MVMGIRKFRSAVFVGLSASILGACSSVPDAANPVEWYKSAESAVTGGPGPQASRVKRLDSEGKEIKNAEIAGGLAPDRSRAKYADDDVKRDTGSGGPPVPPKEVAKLAPAAPTAKAAPVAPAASAAPVLTPPPAAPAYAQPAVPQTLTGTQPGDPIDEVFRRRLAESAGATGQIAPTAPRSVAQPAPMPAPMMAPVMAQQPQYAPPPSASRAVASANASGRPQPFVPYLSPSDQPGYVEPVNLRPPPGVVDRSRSTAYAPIKASGPAFLASTIYFGSGSTKISASDRQKLARAIDAARDRDGFIRVVGHASPGSGGDQMGMMSANFQIAMDRANAVARELQKLGAPADRIRIEANTSGAPGLSNDESAERRAEIFVES
jgi:outer membrane protein OmpA-like peptidoglycan-associated protein